MLRLLLFVYLFSLAQVQADQCSLAGDGLGGNAVTQIRADAAAQVQAV